MTAALLVAITAVAAGLRLVHLGDVPGNPFYDAAVHTMAGSWHAFLFGALDPSGGVSVDKPPVDLWLQVVSVKLLGYNATALKLPQALAGTASVVVLFDLVRRAAGNAAGLAAAAALAVFPIAVLTARSDTMDTAMSFLLLVAAWCVLHAIERQRSAWLIAAGATIGLAFNVKLFQALLVVPALGLLWLLRARVSWRRRLVAATAAVVVAALVGLAWITPVALTPASARPYPIGSTNGSIWNLVFVFNGADRLHGRPLTTPDTLPAGSTPSAAIRASQQRNSRYLSTSASATRLLGVTHHFGVRIGTELFPALAALAGLIALAIARRRRDPFVPAAIVGLGAWMLTGVVLFSGMSTFHPRYFETISPAVAGVLGLALALLVLQGGRLGRALAAAVVLATGIYVEWLAQYIGSAAHWQLAACVVAALLLVAVAIRDTSAQHLVVATLAAAMVALLIVPTSTSWAIVHTRAYDAERSGAMPPGWPPLINRYLAAHRHGMRFAFASIAPAKAAPLIAAKPEPVLMLTSYRSRPLLSIARLAAIARAGEVRYFLIGHRCTSHLTRTTAACPATARWVIAHSTDITRTVGIGHRGLIYRLNLCSPRPAQTASARGRSATRSGRPRSARSANRPHPARCVRRLRA
jgi:4-amino-4-deoxy-L-arabinose transferase-like glycosyltransferase